MSLNTFGLKTSWSDGAQSWTGMLDSCSVRCCPSCNVVLWKAELDVVGILPPEPWPLGWFMRLLAKWDGDKAGHLRAEREWNELPPAWKLAEHGRRIQYPALQRTILAMAASNPEREIFLRRRIWWATNDHIRLRIDGSPVAEVSVADEADRRANMLRMIEIHEAAGSGLAERAELFRQMGQFDDAIRLLTSGAAEVRASENAAWTLRWAKAADPEVKRFG